MRTLNIFYIKMSNCEMKYMLVFSFFFFFSCSDRKKDNISLLVDKWMRREIVFPEDLIFTIQGIDTVDCTLHRNYKIITYVDSAGCTSCKLSLSEWGDLIEYFDSMSIDSVQFLFFFSPKKSIELRYALRTNKFKYPVCIDYSDSFNKINQLPNDRMFHAFLLDEANKVMGIGNPVGNPKIKELYLDMIQRKKVDKPMRQPQTEVGIICSLIDMGTFDWKQEQMAHFTLKNTGNNPLVIIDVATSCGCTSVEYPKEPMHSGRSVELKVRYKADHPEHFNKTISVYCNAASSPIKLAVKGRAE